MGNKNPWIGWSSYDEDSILSGKAFVGRDVESSELFFLIDNNLLVTLYGKSGIGKTSLLNVGVFPSLRAADYEPIVCRCGKADYFKSILRQIESKCTLISDCPMDEITGLVELFKHTKFSKDGNIVFPVLIFDQFEDWFRLNRDSVDGLLNDINILTSEDFDGITNFRFVISIREDYLYLLEDAVDSQRLHDFKQNRYRLTELKRSQAEEIFDLGDIDSEVRKRLLEMTRGNNGHLPGLISFFCSELYNLYPSGITSSALTLLEDKNALIEKYYNRCFERGKLSASTKKYIEANLQDEGFRRPQNLKAVERHVPKAELQKLLGGDTKLLRIFPVGDENHVELIHDRIAEIINHHKMRQTALYQQFMVQLLLILYYVVIGYACVWKMSLNLLRASWGFNDGNVASYVQGLLHTDQYAVPEHFALCKILILSQICAYIVAIGILIVRIPRAFCEIGIQNRLPKVLGISGLILLCSMYLTQGVFTISLNLNTYLFIIMGWLIIVGLFKILEKIK